MVEVTIFPRSEIRVRRADLDDPILVRLQRRILPSDFILKPEPGTFWWAAWRGAKPIAFAALSPSNQWRDVGYLSRAGVIRSERGQGIQKRLISARLRHAATMGWEAVVTDTIPSNPASINSLIACGFKSYVPRKPWAGDSNYWIRTL